MSSFDLAPQLGQAKEEKEEVFTSLLTMLTDIDPKDKLIVGGDLTAMWDRWS